MALVLIPVCAGGMQTVSGRAGTLPHKRQLLAARTWQYVVARLLNAPQLFCVKQDNLRCCSRVVSAAGDSNETHALWFELVDNK